MKCTRCSALDTRVLESRLIEDGRAMRRRRACQDCNHRFTTYEKEEESILQVQKKDGRLEDFSREKIIRALQTACRKRDIKLDSLEQIVMNLETHLGIECDRVVQSKTIGDLVMLALKKLDQVAYVRFASIYKEFKSAEEFKSEIELFSEPGDSLSV